jgi:TatD DNase family protein
VLVDSHCHLNLLDDCDAKLAAARAAGVLGFLCIGVNRDSHADVLAVAERHDDVWATAGVHPEGVGAAVETDWIRDALRHSRIVGIGETGLDYFRGADLHVRNRQRSSFAAHLALGAEYDAPVVVHTRAADDDTIDLLRAHPNSTGVLHCFTESWMLASAALDLGWYVSISGIVTFANAANVRDVAGRIPDDRLLVETDCPWLAPVPHRGKTNEPAFVTHTAAYLAMMRGQDVERLTAQTSQNFARLFKRTGFQSRSNSSSKDRKSVV